MPGAMQFDVSVAYDGAFDFAGLAQGGQDVGRRDTLAHDLTTTITFAPVDGVAVWLGLPANLSRTISFVDAQQMLYDPITKSGVMGGSLADPPKFKGSGLSGLWVGLSLAPFAERYERNQQASWRIDLGYRAPIGRSFYDQSDRAGGGALGAHAFTVDGAFSADNDRTSPYITAGWMMETRREAMVPDSQGSLQTVRVQPGMRVYGKGGLEILVSRLPSKPFVRTAIDLHVGMIYRTWSDSPSGFLLPSVLPETMGLAATRSEHLSFGGGLGVVADVHRFVGLRLGAELFYAMPHRQEHYYPVLASSVALNVHTEVVIRYR
jgi:hypothetical protein